ncbi:hypothetical protein AB4212_43775, partial [Streptomyces sp. 2MCAF27]
TKVHRAWGRDFHLAGARRKKEAASVSDDSRSSHQHATDGEMNAADSQGPYASWGPYGPGD